MITVLRWLAIPPAIVAAWLLTILLGFGLLDMAFRFCPPEDVVSGMCMSSWFHYVEIGIITGCAGIAAALIIAVSAFLAPSHRVTVASVVLGGGVVVAFYMAYTSGAWGSFGGAVVAGGITWSVLLRLVRIPARGAGAL